MVTGHIRPRRPPSRSSSRAAWLRARRRQRGASVLIVFLVVTMLTGIGMFAARSATLSTTVAGSSKQLAQTRRITEYATTAAAAALGRDPQRYVQRMPLYVAVPNDPKCPGIENMPNTTCYPLGRGQLEDEAGGPLIVPGDALAKIPGGLGHAAVEADFNIAVTDLAPAAPPVPGEALNQRGGLSYWSVTFTATAQLRPVSLPADLLKNLAASASVQSWRAHVVVGPFSNPSSRPPGP